MKAWWADSIGFFDAKIKGTRGTVDTLNKKSSDAARGVAAATQDAVKGALGVSKDAAAVTQGAVKGALDASKDAAGAIVRLPNTRVVEVHERCATAPNGAPDCGAAATAACRSKGFATAARRSMFAPRKNVIPHRRCSKGSARARPIARSKSVITRAMCQ